MVRVYALDFRAFMVQGQGLGFSATPLKQEGEFSNITSAVSRNQKRGYT